MLRSRWIFYVPALLLPLVAGALVDLPARRRTGSLTWLGIAALAQLGAAAAAIAADPPRPRSARELWPLAALLGWIALGHAWWTPHPDALPNVLAYLLFAGTVAAAHGASASSSRRTAAVIGAAMWAVDAAGLGIAAFSFGARGFDVNAWMVHPRALALFALVPLAWHLASWLAGRSIALARAALWLAAIFVSLSRMATAAALLVVLLTLTLQASRAGSGRRRAAAPLAVLALLLVAAVTVAPFRARLQKPEDRTPIWRRVASSALEAPLLGKGPGSSQTGPVLRYWWTTPPARPRGQTYEQWEYWAPHPHDEYLRVWHDLGASGITLLLVALATWLRALARSWRRPSDAGSERPLLGVAGLLMLVALMCAMLTDNPLVYPFVIAPAGLLIGAGLGAAAPAREG